MNIYRKDENTNQEINKTTKSEYNYNHNNKENSDKFIYLDQKLLNYYAKSNKKRYSNVCCVNCGERGHIVRDCVAPITSFGIIAFKVVNHHLEELYDKNNYIKQLCNDFVSDNISNKFFPKIKFLMIQRKDTMAYIDFVRGKYPVDNEEEKNKLLKIWLNEMTFSEKYNLLTKTFDQIWDEMWVNHESKCYKNEYEKSKNKFLKLDIVNLVKNSEYYYPFPEFGFPKGRRSIKETNVECAQREFLEETGYDKDSYKFLTDCPTIKEEFTGTNGIRYRHVYYLVNMKKNVKPPIVDKNDIIQTGEVKNMGWFTFEECFHLMRPYDKEKKKILTDVYSSIKNMNFIFNLGDSYKEYVYTPYKRENKYYLYHNNKKFKFNNSLDWNKKNIN